MKFVAQYYFLIPILFLPIFNNTYETKKISILYAQLMYKKLVGFLREVTDFFIIITLFSFENTSHTITDHLLQQTTYRYEH